MVALVMILSFVIGLVVGSFLNVVILRGFVGERLGGRSHCDSCGKTLSVRELIPVVSFVIQKARCRSCGAGLSWQYPLVELATALSFSVAAWVLVPRLEMDIYSWLMLVVADIVIASLIVITVADMRFQIIPDGAVAFLLAAGIGASIMRGGFLRDAVAAVSLALFFASLWFFSRGRWVGLGDAKLILATSLALGFPASIAAFLFSFWLGGTLAIPLLATGRKSMTSRIPFGPFIIAGTILAWWVGARFLAMTGLLVFW